MQVLSLSCDYKEQAYLLFIKIELACLLYFRIIQASEINLNYLLLLNKCLARSLYLKIFNYVYSISL